jgi:hypothetical protein
LGLDVAAQKCGLKRATLARIVLERWLDNPQPLFNVPSPPKSQRK